jgi:glycosyltransferase involved in cell wall biosynthesis
MHICFLMTQSLDSPSGIGRFGPLARYLVQQGHTVQILALHPAFQGLAQRVFTQDGVEIRYVAQMHVLRTGNYKSYFGPRQLLSVAFQATWALAAAAVRSGADVFHICKAQPMNGLAGSVVAGWLRRPMYVDCDDLEVAINRFSGEWQRTIVGWWENHLPQAARAVTVNTHFQQARCQALGVPADKIHLVPNGFDPERFRPIGVDERAALRATWGLQGHPVVLYLGTLSLANHPVLLLLDAFADVYRCLPEARLWLVGGGEDYDVISAAVRERGLSAAVVQAGAIDAARAPVFYAASDVSVDPVEDNDVARSRCPLKIAESMACGVPVVTGDIGDRRAQLGGGAAGVLVRPGDSHALAQGILSVLQDRGRQEVLSAGALETSQQFRWDRLAADFAKVYDH